MLIATIAFGLIDARIAGAAELNLWPAGVPFPEVTVQAAPPDDGPSILSLDGRPSEDRRVVGIAFVDSEGFERVCSGLYLNARHVLTAKHCTCHANDYRVTGSTDMTSRRATWTAATLQPFFQAGAACLNTRDFKPAEGNDVAILTLNAPLLDDARQPVNQATSLLGDILPLDSWRATGAMRVRLVGYGSTTADGQTIGRQNDATMQINSTDCGSRAARSLGCRAYREMIIGLRRRGEPPVDSCAGDSGGPVFLPWEGREIPIGLVSRSVTGGRLGELCGQGGIYTLLGRSDLIAWLNARLGRD
ncbi:MAG: trypsin-like serine protease [Rhizobium sp.]|nr:trypsin-like serine protease [Rhizobium sp.]